MQVEEVRVGWARGWVSEAAVLLHRSHGTSTMGEIKYSRRKERISKSRAAKASLLTGATVVLFLIGCYHAWWVVQALYSKKYGSNLNTLVVAGGSLVLNFAASAYTLIFLETRLLSDHIDSDHKKYL